MLFKKYNLFKEGVKELWQKYGSEGEGFCFIESFLTFLLGWLGIAADFPNIENKD